MSRSRKAPKGRKLMEQCKRAADRAQFERDMNANGIGCRWLAHKLWRDSGFKDTNEK